MTVLALLSHPDAVVVAAAIGAVSTVLTAAIGAGLIVRRVRRVEHAQDAVLAEVSPNGGRSMKDQLTRLEARVRDVEQILVSRDARLSQLEESSAVTRAGVAALLDAAGIEVAKGGQRQ